MGLADALEKAEELELLEAAMSLEGKREELSALLGALEEELGARAVRAKDRRGLLRAAELVRQLSGWLCAGMFARD